MMDMWGNNTTATTPAYVLDIPPQAKIVILSLILIACLLGNILITTTVIWTKKLRTPSNILIVNLAICDAMTALGAIPFTLIAFGVIYGYRRWPYGPVGCTLIWPITTYSHNSSVFTLAVIAVERYISISYISPKFTKPVTSVVVAMIHVVAFVVVIPYSVTLHYDAKNATCEEIWDDADNARDASYRQAYTVSLLVIQYIIPLTIMGIFYTLAWRKLYIHNIYIIKMSEDYEKKMDWKRTYLKELRRSAVLNESPNFQHLRRLSKGGKSSNDEIATRFNNKNNQGNHNKPATERFSLITVNGTTSEDLDAVEMKRFRKSPYISQEAYVRHRQSLRTLKMFTVVVIVFIISSLPNHIFWFYPHNGTRYPIVKFVCIVVNYMAPVLNCWIYGWFNNGIRTAYLKTITCTHFRHSKTYNTQTSLNVSGTTSPSLYTTKQEELFRRRMSLFNTMFREYKENLDNEIVEENFMQESTIL